MGLFLLVIAAAVSASPEWSTYPGSHCFEGFAIFSPGSATLPGDGRVRLPQPEYFSRDRRVRLRGAGDPGQAPSDYQVLSRRRVDVVRRRLLRLGWRHRQIILDPRPIEPDGL